jgi:hypothetical protein
MTHRRLATVVLIVVVCSGCDVWSQWGSQAARTGRNVDLSFSASTASASVASVLAPIAPTGQLAVVDGFAFVTRDGSLTALDVRTGAIVWTAELPAGSTVGGAPAVDLGSKTVFVDVATSSNPVLLGFDVSGFRNCNTFLNTCAAVFRADLGSAGAPATPAAVVDGKVFANGGNDVYAFDAAGQTGCAPSLGVQVCAPVWSAPTGFSASGVGPSVDHGVLYDPIADGSTFGIRAFDAATGSVRWTGSTGTSAVAATPSVGRDVVFAPVGDVVKAFARSGCGSADCTPVFSLERKSGDRMGSFLQTVAIDASVVFATNSNGSVYRWAESGCGASTCQPTADAAVHSPGAADYRQMPAIASGLVFVLAQPVSESTHVVLVAFDENLTETTRWDLGVADLAPGLSSPSLFQGAVYAPTSNAIEVVRPRSPAPLASLSVSPGGFKPAFARSTFDYVVACAAGTNTLTFDMAAVPGGSVRLVAPTTTSRSPSQSATVQVAENQAVVVEAVDATGGAARYWIRCLPHDFPPITVTPHPEAGTPTPGWYMTSNFRLSTTPSYAMVLDTNGTPVWYRHAWRGHAVDVKMLGKDVIAYMSTSAGGFGTDPNDAYDVYNLDTNQTTHIATVGVPTDDHELRPLVNGNYLLLSYVLRGGFDLTGIGGDPTPRPNSTIADCEVQEIDPQGQLVWKWDATDHIDPVTENTSNSTATVNGQTVYDVYHCNSVDAIPGGDVLISGRHLSAVYRIRRSDGKVLWKMGGKPVNKDLGQIITISNYPATTISGQHDARFLSNGNVSVFDNNSFGSGPGQGVEFAIDFTTSTAHPVFRFENPAQIRSSATGSFRRYPDGHSVACWGIAAATPGGPMIGANFSEINAAGVDVLDMAFGTGDWAYRVVKVPPPRFDINVLRATAGQ